MVIDAWVNLFPEAFASKWVAQEENRGVRQLFGDDLAKGPTVEGLLAAMDDAGIQTGVLTAGLSDPERAHRRSGPLVVEDRLKPVPYLHQVGRESDDFPNVLVGIGVLVDQSLGPVCQPGAALHGVA